MDRLCSWICVRLMPGSHQMTDAFKDICLQIKDGIDDARRKGVWCSYPSGVWINDQCHPWPFADTDPPIKVASLAHALAPFNGDAPHG